MGVVASRKSEPTVKTYGDGVRRFVAWAEESGVSAKLDRGTVNATLSVGADFTIAPVLAAGVISVAAVGTVEYSTVMAVAALLIGTVLVAAGLLHLGWIAEFLSTPVITGLLAGIAVEIIVRQLATILGLAGGGTTTIGLVRRIAEEVGHTNGWSLGIRPAS